MQPPGRRPQIPRQPLQPRSRHHGSRPHRSPQLGRRRRLHPLERAEAQGRGQCAEKEAGRGRHVPFRFFQRGEIISPLRRWWRLRKHAKKRGSGTTLPPQPQCFATISDNCGHYCGTRRSLRAGIQEYNRLIDAGAAFTMLKGGPLTEVGMKRKLTDLAELSPLILKERLDRVRRAIARLEAGRPAESPGSHLHI